MISLPRFKQFYAIQHTTAIDHVDYFASITDVLPWLAIYKHKVSSKAKGKYSKADFNYDAERIEYVCPAGERLTYRFDSVENDKTLRVYMRYGCSSCALRPQCTTATEKRIKRWEHEGILNKAQDNLNKHPEAMRQRKAIVEHPFSTIKQLMGSTHFLLRRLPNVKAEMSLHVLAYNMKRAINVLGAQKIIGALQSA